MSDYIWTADEIRALRKLGGESTAEFAARFGRSRRTVEDWEQGRYGPDVAVCRAMAARARRLVAARARRTARAGASVPK